jgi:hypothetical protein
LQKKDRNSNVPRRLLTDHSDEFGTAFTANYHPLFICSRVLDKGSLRIEKLHIPNHHIPNTTVTISMSLLLGKGFHLRKDVISSRR